MTATFPTADQFTDGHSEQAQDSANGRGADTLDSIADFFAPPHMLARRRRRRQLALLSDAQLASVGLTRAQVIADNDDLPGWNAAGSDAPHN